MDREQVSYEVMNIITKVKNTSIDDFDENMLGHKFNFSARDMAYICLEVGKLFNIDLNHLVKLFSFASVNSLISAVCELKKVS